MPMQTARPAPKKKAKPMGMRSTAPRMQGPISGGAGGGFTQQPGPGVSAPMAPMGPPPMMGPPQRGPMPMPPSAAQRPAPPMMGAPMRPGPPMGMPPQGRPFQGGGFAPPGQPPAGGPPMGPPPMMDAGMARNMAGFGGGRFGVKPGMNSIGAPPLANSPAPGQMPQKQMPDLQALQQMMAARGGGQPQF